MTNIPAMFGCQVFHDGAMKARLPKDTYLALKKTIELGTHLELDVANVVANEMKNWAVEHGVTHFTHWFQPMTGMTAEKHDSFITVSGNGTIIMEFSGKELVRGEPDASSFPSGGLRTTFEARGYTVWDTSSYAFIKDTTLYIPTAFCAYSGQALDQKTPLLRSMEALDKQAMRILRLFGNTTARRVITTVGPEQEYFLIDKAMYVKRADLVNCGRTLFGAKPPKGQEMDDHYFGKLKPRVSAFMKELDEELWKLGVLAKTKHNEVAPGQHELAPIFTVTNIATDHNQLTMELMKSIADKHGLACLLHEKPFAGVNGSGKHNNWSMATDTGINLLEPGDTPSENAQFLLFLCAVLKAVDQYQDLLRVSVATPGNDHRLGGNEAPPAIISIFLGEELTEILNAIETDTPYQDKEKTLMEIGATVLPHFPKDGTDRNRTSPFAFTGNKFEFRMPGSSSSIAGPNIMLNTIVAQALMEFADQLEQGQDWKKDLSALIKSTIQAHKRILFNGNNYTDQWVQEAAQRGLLHLSTAVDAIPMLVMPKNVALFGRHHVFTKTELFARYEILLEHYQKTIHIEALTMIMLIKKEILPCSISYQTELMDLMESKQKWGIKAEPEQSLLRTLSLVSSELYSKTEDLESMLLQHDGDADLLETAKYYRDRVLPIMTQLRPMVEILETTVSQKYWTLPTYEQLQHSVD